MSTVGATDQIATPPVGPAPMVAEIRQGRWADVWRAISRNRKALVGVLLLLVFVVLAIFPGQIAPDDPSAQIYLPAVGPSWHHLLGTTGRGEDVFSQLVWGTRLSLVIALAVGALATVLSVVIGVSAAYLGGIADGVLSLITDVILVLPTFPLIIVRGSPAPLASALVTHA
jgi:peptide/nickel transport system permease protein